MIQFRKFGRKKTKLKKVSLGLLGSDRRRIPFCHLNRHKYVDCIRKTRNKVRNYSIFYQFVCFRNGFQFAKQIKRIYSQYIKYEPVRQGGTKPVFAHRYSKG